MMRLSRGIIPAGLGFRIPASDAAALLRNQIEPVFQTITLDIHDLHSACGQAEALILIHKYKPKGQLAYGLIDD